VFPHRRPRAERFLSLLYAIPGGLSPSQFTRWHLDHHAELGSAEADPKRHFLSPKINRRWLKLLYWTPALFPLYFRAARRATASYPSKLQAAIRSERYIAIAFHLAVLAALAGFVGSGAALRVHLIPVFVVFPIAFALNRLGQHYDVVPDDPAQWATLLRSNPFWNFVYLNSNFHLEHHYFPGVPLYRLPELQRELRPFYERRGMRWRSYSELLYAWFARNCAPHTDWSRMRGQVGAR